MTADVHRTSATVDGRVVQAFVDGVAETCGHFEQRARRLLADNGIENPEGSASYAFGDYLGAVRAVQRTTGPNTVNRIGRAVAAQLPWSRDVDTIEAAFDDLDRAYKHAHAGDSAGSFRFEANEDGGVLVSDTPYPAAFEQGLIEGIGKQFGTDTGFIALHDAGRYLTDGGDVREFDLTWWGTRAEPTTISPPRDAVDRSGVESAKRTV